MEKERVKAFADKVFGDMAGAMASGLVFLGVKTGLFRAMAGKGFLTLEELVGMTKLQSRYVEEWLKGMVCAGYLEYEPSADTYHLPDEHAFLLASEGTDHFVGGLFCMAPVLLRVAPRVARVRERRRGAIRRLWRGRRRGLGLSQSRAIRAPLRRTLAQGTP